MGQGQSGSARVRQGQAWSGRVRVGVRDRVRGKAGVELGLKNDRKLAISYRKLAVSYALNSRSCNETVHSRPGPTCNYHHPLVSSSRAGPPTSVSITQQGYNLVHLRQNISLSPSKVIIWSIPDKTVDTKVVRTNSSLQLPSQNFPRRSGFGRALVLEVKYVRFKPFLPSRPRSRPS